MRKGMAMLELIFSIVIMGMAMLVIPMLMTMSNKSTYTAINQEAIAIASTEIGLILTNHWDEQNTDLNTSAPILITAGNADLGANIETGKRAGIPYISSGRSFLTSMGGGFKEASSNFNDGDLDDLDDFNGRVSKLALIGEAQTKTGDYVDKLSKITTTVSYVDDTPSAGTYKGSSNTLVFNDPFNKPAGGGTTSIKRVEVLLNTDSENEKLQKNLRLNAFSCNIGTYKLNERRF